MVLTKENAQLKNDNAVMKAGLIEVKDEKLDLYKSVIDEVGEYINTMLFGKEWVEKCKDDLLKILDKVNKESE